MSVLSIYVKIATADLDNCIVHFAVVINWLKL